MLTHPDLASMTSWSAEDDLGSDHLPMFIQLHNPIQVHFPVDTRPKWKRNNVDWQLFSTKVEKNVRNFSALPLSLKKRTERFNDTTLEVAHKVVEKVKTSRRTKQNPPTVKDEIKRHNRLRKDVQSHRGGGAEWVEASCQDAAKLVKEAKESSWFEFLSDLKNDSDAGNQDSERHTRCL